MTKLIQGLTYKMVYCRNFMAFLVVVRSCEITYNILMQEFGSLFPSEGFSHSEIAA